MKKCYFRLGMQLSDRSLSMHEALHLVPITTITTGWGECVWGSYLH
jgi:hypothetical protein